MKAITLWQPWASLLACGAKKYETRSWATSYRGPIAIHAAQKSIAEGLDVFDSYDSILALYEAFRAHSIIPADLPLAVAGPYVVEKDALPRGAIVATAELVACHWIRSYIDETAESCIMVGPEPLPIIGDECHFGDWTPGRYAWEFANMKMLDTPIPARGGQRLWNWEGVA